MELTNRETAIVLAALRMAQDNMDDLNHMPQMDVETRHVKREDVNDLCEKINCS